MPGSPVLGQLFQCRTRKRLLPVQVVHREAGLDLVNLVQMPLDVRQASESGTTESLLFIELATAWWYLKPGVTLGTSGAAMMLWRLAKTPDYRQVLGSISVATNSFTSPIAL